MYMNIYIYILYVTEPYERDVHIYIDVFIYSDKYMNIYVYIRRANDPSVVLDPQQQVLTSATILKLPVGGPKPPRIVIDSTS